MLELEEINRVTWDPIRRPKAWGEGTNVKRLSETNMSAARSVTLPLATLPYARYASETVNEENGERSVGKWIIDWWKAVRRL